MKTGCAVWHQATHSGPKYKMWEKFQDAFVSEFCLKNESQLALAKLETMTYHQGKQSVDNYVDDFQELIDQAGYMEGLTIMVKFHRGLTKGIQDQITNIPIRRPADNNPEAWYNTTIRADENRQQTPVVCHRCRKAGHYAKDCEKCFDIRYMLAEEKQEWLQNFALEADALELKEEEEEPEGDPPPDFRSRSE